jgi:hypothetical protein
VLTLKDGGTTRHIDKGLWYIKHEEYFRKEAAAIDQAFIDTLKSLNRNGSYFGALADTLPSTADRKALRAALPNLVANRPPLGQLARVGTVWSTK